MKKIIATLLAAVMLVGCMLAFTSCAQPAIWDLDKAEENLKDNDYSVSYIDNEDELEAGVAKKLYASKDEEYLSITVYKDTKTAKYVYENLKLEYDMGLKFYKNEINRLENLLKKHKDDLSDSQIERYEDDIKDYKEYIDEAKKESTFGRIGKTVWYGTKTAAEDSRG